MKGKHGFKGTVYELICRYICNIISFKLTKYSKNIFETLKLRSLCLSLLSHYLLPWMFTSWQHWNAIIIKWGDYRKKEQNDEKASESNDSRDTKSTKWREGKWIKWIKGHAVSKMTRRHLWYNVNIAPLWRLVHLPCVNELRKRRKEEDGSNKNSEQCDSNKKV